MRYGPIDTHWNRDHSSSRLLVTFANGRGNLAGLAKAKPDTGLAIADYDDRIKAERATAFDNLGHAFDTHDPFFVARAAVATAS